MQKIVWMFGLAFTFFIGMISIAIDYSDEQYLELKEIYGEHRWNLEKEFKEKFKSSSNYFKEQKQAIYEKSKSDPTSTVEQINQMLRDVFCQFVDRQEDIKTEYKSKVDALNAMFEKKFDEFDDRIPL